MANSDGSNRRRLPRYLARHRVTTTSVNRQELVQGVLRDLSEGGCSLRLPSRIPPGTVIEARCNVSGIGLRIRGEVVWIEESSEGVLHGIAFTGFTSEEDALFHRVYLQRLARGHTDGAA